VERMTNNHHHSAMWPSEWLSSGQMVQSLPHREKQLGRWRWEKLRNIFSIIFPVQGEGEMSFWATLQEDQHKHCLAAA
jgi:hypothetical protein